ncbi:MAG TPA: L,D-transpeptidase family protein [Stellaceae bacterium]
MFLLRRFSTRRCWAFGGPLAGGAIALAAAFVLAAPAVLAAPSAVSASSELARLLEGGPGFAIAGERLNIPLLRRFYARHGFEPVWTSRPAQVTSLTNAVLHAGDHGLTPELFHGSLLMSPTLPPLYRDLVLSDAFLSYADALARGALPVERRPDDEALTPQPIDVAAVLDKAAASSDPAGVIEALAPTTPTYRLLRQTLRTFRDNGTSPRHLREIEVNLERERWMPRPLPPDRVVVNVADERVTFYRNDQPAFSAKVIVGQDELRNQSPEFQATIDGILFNPPWSIPPDIAANEILPKAAHDPNYLARHNMVMLPNGILQQRAGPNSGLGQLMLYMDNRFDVYLHDTPSKSLFGRDDRRISHGCIRVEQLADLAALLMREPVQAIDQAIATGNTTRANLPQAVPVFVTYETAFADADGKLQFRPDIYGRDAEIWDRLDPERRSAAEETRSGQRGG